MSESGQVTAAAETPRIHSFAVALDEASAEPPPAWIELIPAGEFSGRDGRGPYRLEDAAEVAATTQKLRMDAGIPIDYDHATDFAAPEGRPAPAAGWIKELTGREGALWGRVEWTQHGAAALATKEYRYISPVFEHDADGVIVRLLRAALTNNPNLYLKAIAAQAQGACINEATNSSAVAACNQSREARQTEIDLERLRKTCGLPSNITVQEIIEALRQSTLAQSRHAATEQAAQSVVEVSEPLIRGELNSDADYVAAEAFRKTARELGELQERTAGERIARAVERAIQCGKLVPAQRDWALSYCKADYDGFESFVARQPTLALNVAAVEGKPRRDSWSSNAPNARSADANDGLSMIERAVCSRLGIGVEQFSNRKTARAMTEALPFAGGKF